MYNLLFIVNNFGSSLVFALKYGYDSYTKQKESENDSILNFDVKTA